MVTFFTEKDLISFGTYMISPERKVDYATQLEADKLSAALAQVNTYDIEKWAQMELAALAPVNQVPLNQEVNNDSTSSQ